MHIADYTYLDAALERLAGQGPNLTNGFVNHAPMVVEALVAMGRPQAATAWIETHHKGGLAAQDAVMALDHKHWKAALGSTANEDRWRALFRQQCAEATWQSVLDLWTPRLAPGVSAAALHGLIRVGHAVRALSVADTALRRRELAEGFALWAATFQTLPTDMAATPGCTSASAVLNDMPFVPEDKRCNAGAITTALTRLPFAPGFEQVIVAIDWKQPLPALAHEIGRAMALVFLQQVDTHLKAIVYTHALTSTAAVLNIAPHLHDDRARQLLSYVWQAGCGLYAAYGVRPSPTHAVLPRESEDQSCERAIAHGDDHVIKLTEACLRFHAETGDSLFLDLPVRARALL